MAGPGERSTSVSAVDEAGVHLTSGEDLAVDVLFDGRRIWSFWTQRDVTDGVAEWPGQLRRFLDGHTDLRVVEHVSGTELYAVRLRLGTSDGPIRVVDGEGRPLGIDKSNRVARTFDTRDAAQTEPLLDATEQVLRALHEAGVEAFPAYGTLLGAVREGTFIGHDSDVDLGYVSRHTHPVDVVRESLALQRALVERGFPVDRYSGAAFKVEVREADGGRRGLDVFGGFFLHGRLYLLGEIGTPFEEEWVFPLGTTSLAGRTLPAPAVPEKLLEATYGPGWRVPDPAFHFETPRTTVRRLNGWFRGIRIMRNEWDRRYSTIREKLPPLEPSPLARHVHEQESGPYRVLDLGAGRGTDSLWLARQGVPVVALDYAVGSDDAVCRVAEEEALPRQRGWVNLHELRSVLAQGARAAHLAADGIPNVVLANHLLDSTDAHGLAAAVRFARMALASGGRVYADYDTVAEGAPVPRRDASRIRPVPMSSVERAFRDAGADIVLHEQVHDRRGPGGADRTVARVVAQWRR